MLSVTIPGLPVLPRLSPNAGVAYSRANPHADGLDEALRKGVPKSRNRRDLYQSRGDKTPIELFLQGVAAIEPHIQRLILAFVHRTPPQN